ncbi:hypothetical protein F7644_09675 [Tenacibaculum finnmarkense genomovar ulcerans]|uniref:hypothetical protein n=1 Tax=Tenacibaculum finnmarkense TaxID=2781243 RepID=UPI00187B12FA|nr:hypothetical protein [Tenacibaculum finnmarkense]MBE7646256.1 hypothetical protein [Tenacibaculum finnmarkense genomovar ulcerans]
MKNKIQVITGICKIEDDYLHNYASKTYNSVVCLDGHMLSIYLEGTLGLPFGFGTVTTETDLIIICDIVVNDLKKYIYKIHNEYMLVYNSDEKIVKVKRPKIIITTTDLIDREKLDASLKTRCLFIESSISLYKGTNIF